MGQKRRWFISVSDADDLANSIAVAEQLDNESRAERNIVPNNHLFIGYYYFNQI
jgi:hypothetical protein